MSKKTDRKTKAEEIQESMRKGAMGRYAFSDAYPTDRGSQDAGFSKFEFICIEMAKAVLAGGPYSAIDIHTTPPEHRRGVAKFAVLQARVLMDEMMVASKSIMKEIQGRGEE